MTVSDWTHRVQKSGAKFRNGDVAKTIPRLLPKSANFREFGVKHMVGTSGRQLRSGDDAGKYPASIPTADEMESLNELSAHLLGVINARVVENRSLARKREELLLLLMSGTITVRAAEQIVGEVT